tara:strand:- start:1013 stop:1402 length:390 start_codon:yes stop_codon:yes gene_type:complete
MGEYDDLIRESNKFKNDRDERYKSVSKDRLLKISQKKIQTTMIGALSSVEKHFGFLWGYQQEGDLTAEQQHMKDLFEEVRAEILDRGNNQMRNLEAEMAHYDVNWLRYHMAIPFKPQSTKQGEGEEDNG